MSRDTFEPGEVAALTGLTTATVMRHIRRKTLKAHRVRGYVIAAADVREFLIAQAANKRKPVK